MDTDVSRSQLRVGNGLSGFMRVTGLLPSREDVFVVGLRLDASHRRLGDAEETLDGSRRKGPPLSSRRTYTIAIQGFGTWKTPKCEALIDQSQRRNFGRET